MISDKYNQLPSGKKRTLRAKFINLFGNKATFYNKVYGRVKIRPAEQIFFNENLNA